MGWLGRAYFGIPFFFFLKYDWHAQMLKIGEHSCMPKSSINVHKIIIQVWIVLQFVFLNFSLYSHSYCRSNQINLLTFVLIFAMDICVYYVLRCLSCLTEKLISLEVNRCLRIFTWQFWWAFLVSKCPRRKWHGVPLVNLCIQTTT